MKNKKILVGTSKGLVEFGKKENEWKIVKVHFLGLPVSTIYKNEITVLGGQVWLIGIGGKSYIFQMMKGKLGKWWLHLSIQKVSKLIKVS